MTQDSFTCPPLSVHSRDGKTLLATPCMEFRKGKTYAITGVSGSGKTLFLESLFSDQGIFRTKDRHFYMVQNPGGGLTPHLNIKSHFKDLHMSLKLKDNSCIYEDNDWTSLDFTATGDRYPASFSGGEKQKMMASMIFYQKPEVLVCDEPAANLDPVISHSLFQWIIEEKKKRPFTFIFVTHQWNHIQTYADEVIVIHDGEMAFKGTYQTLLERKDKVQSSDSSTLWLQLQGLRKDVVEKRRTECDQPPRQEPAIQVEGLTLQYGQRFLFRNFSWHTGTEKWWWIRGDNGSGKSTFAKLLAGLLSPDAGDLFINGEQAAFPLAQRKQWTIPPIQYVFQHGVHLFNPNRTMGNQLKNTYGDDGSRLRHYMEKVNLNPVMLNRYPSSLSLGEKQRFNLIRALGTKPEVLICDELFASLDFSVTVKLINFLREIQEQDKFTLMLITHSEFLFHLRPGGILQF